MSTPETTAPQETAPTSNGLLAKALLAAQKEMPAVQPDAVNPHFKSKFVSLGHLIAKVRPVLNKHGLAFTQFPARDQDGAPTLVTILMHESGERLEAAAPLLLSKQDAQGQGSAITYMRRYALASALGISDQEDDDGAGASGEDKPATEPAAEAGGSKTITEKEARGLLDRAKQVGVNGERLSIFLTTIGVEHEPITNIKTGVAALRMLSADEAEKCDQFLSDEADRNGGQS